MTKPLPTRDMFPGATIALEGPHGHRVTITMDSERRWWDLETGTEYALADETMMTDKTDKPGAGLISFALYRPLVGAAVSHDFEYSSLAFQVANERSVADEKLGQDAVTLGAPSWFGRVVTWVVGVWGDQLWERISTRWKKRKIFTGMDHD